LFIFEQIKIFIVKCTRRAQAESEYVFKINFSSGVSSENACVVLIEINQNCQKETTPDKKMPIYMLLIFSSHFSFS
jgi:hypothetical protein